MKNGNRKDESQLISIRLGWMAKCGGDGLEPLSLQPASSSSFGVCTLCTSACTTAGTGGPLFGGSTYVVLPIVGSVCTLQEEGEGEGLKDSKGT